MDEIIKSKLIRKNLKFFYIFFTLFSIITIILYHPLHTPIRKDSDITTGKVAALVLSMTLATTPPAQIGVEEFSFEYNFGYNIDIHKEIQVELNEIKFEDFYNASDNITSAYTIQDIALLSALVWRESRGEPYEGQVAVANVLFNRINSNYYPDTVYDVAYQGNGSQFNAVKADDFGYYDEQSVYAVIEAFQTPMFDKSVVYFANVEISTDKKFIQFLLENKVIKIGNHTFARNPKLEK